MLLLQDFSLYMSPVKFMNRQRSLLSGVYANGPKGQVPLSMLLNLPFVTYDMMYVFGHIDMSLDF